MAKRKTTTRHQRRTKSGKVVTVGKGAKGAKRFKGAVKAMKKAPKLRKPKLGPQRQQRTAFAAGKVKEATAHRKKTSSHGKAGLARLPGKNKNRYTSKEGEVFHRVGKGASSRFVKGEPPTKAAKTKARKTRVKKKAKAKAVATKKKARAKVARAKRAKKTKAKKKKR